MLIGVRAVRSLSRLSWACPIEERLLLVWEGGLGMSDGGDVVGGGWGAGGMESWVGGSSETFGGAVALLEVAEELRLILGC